MAAKTTSYIDDQGVKRTGYIIDGRTYEDLEATTPVGKGSIVEAGGKRYVKGVGDNGESMLYSDYLSSRNMKATDYVDSQGLLKVGYIKDGQTYADILATTPVEKGSMVTAGGQTWIKGVGTKGESMLYSDYLKSLGNAGGSAGREETSEDKLLSQLESEAEKSYDREKSANESLYSAKLRESEEERLRAADRLNEDYKALNTQLYRDYMLDKKNLPQLLAAQGISGGLSESSLLGLETGYLGQLSQNERQRLSGIGDIEADAQKTALQLFMERAEADARAEEDYSRRRMELLEEAALRGQKQQEEAAKKTAEKAEQLYAKAIERAETLAKVGDFSGYRAQGYSEEEIAAMEQAYYEEQFAKRLKIAQQKARYGDSSELLALLGMK